MNQNESDDAAIATVRADVDANELASDNAESALSGRLRPGVGSDDGRLLRLSRPA